MAQLTISMAIFNSYVSLPEGNGFIIEPVHFGYGGYLILR